MRNTNFNEPCIIKENEFDRIAQNPTFKVKILEDHIRRNEYFIVLEFQDTCQFTNLKDSQDSILQHWELTNISSYIDIANPGNPKQSIPFVEFTFIGQKASSFNNYKDTMEYDGKLMLMRQSIYMDIIEYMNQNYPDIYPISKLKNTRVAKRFF